MNKPKKINSGTLMALATVGPISLWMLLFVVCPILYVGFISFMQRGRLSGIKLIPTYINYVNILNPTYLSVVYKSVFIALGTTVFCLLLGYPLAYIISRKKKIAGTLMTLLMIPFCCCTLIKCYSFVLLLNAQGVVNTTLMKLHIVAKPIQFLYNDTMTMVGMVYCLLPFAILPLYTSIEKLDYSLIEASQDLGAKFSTTLRRVILPMTAPGIFASVIMVFIPSLGYYMVSDILGGGSELIIGTLIKNQFTIARNWPFGAAIAITLIVLTLLMLFIYSKIGDMDELGGGF